jgi:hypothetical protein
MLLLMLLHAAASTTQQHCTHHAMLTNSAWLCSTIGVTWQDKV